MICLSSASNFASPRLLYRLLHPRSATQCLIYGCPALSLLSNIGVWLPWEAFALFFRMPVKSPPRYVSRTGGHHRRIAIPLARGVMLHLRQKSPRSGSPPTGPFSTNFLDERPVMEIKAFGFRSRNVGETKSGTRTSRQLLDQLNPTKRAHPLVP